MRHLRHLLFGIQWSTKYISWGYFWMKAISGFDFTFSAVVPEYLASCEEDQVFLGLALELVTVPPRGWDLFPLQGELVVWLSPFLVAQLQLQVCTELQLVKNYQYSLEELRNTSQAIEYKAKLIKKKNKKKSPSFADTWNVSLKSPYEEKCLVWKILILSPFQNQK